MTGSQRRRRLAVAGLATVLSVLSGVSGVSTIGTVATRQAAKEARVAYQLANAYDRAHDALAQEEIAEQHYRIEPTLANRAEHADAAAHLDAAMTDIRARGDADDRALTDRVTELQRQYDDGMNQLFNAVDLQDAVLVQRLDVTVIDPASTAIDDLVQTAAAEHAEAAARAADRLDAVEQLVFVATIGAFAAGLASLAGFSLVAAGYQRRLLRQTADSEHQARHDALTGLPNRSLFIARATDAIDAHLAPSVLMLDLDKFKEVNDTLGHHYGDELLRQVAERTSAAVRTGDTVARLAGDEFAVLLPGTAPRRRHRPRPASAAGTAPQLRPRRRHRRRRGKRRHRPRPHRRRHCRVPAALRGHRHVRGQGHQSRRRRVPANPAHRGQQPPAAPRRPSPRSGHHRPADPALPAEGPPRQRRTVRRRGPGALAAPDPRPDRPRRVHPVAENTGLINRLTRYVLHHTLAQVRSWLNDGLEVPVAVNLSPRCLLDAKLVDQVSAMLTEYGVPAALLRLEVTESAVMANPALATATLRELHDLGIRLSIDDYGTGYSSMVYLKQLPVDELKVDRAFVLHMDTDRDDAVLVRGAIELGHNLGMTVVAEGVEGSAHVAALEALGCDIAQGYHYARPMPAADLTGWIRSRDLTTAVA